MLSPEQDMRIKHPARASQPLIDIYWESFVNFRLIIFVLQWGQAIFPLEFNLWILYSPFSHGMGGDVVTNRIL